MTKYHLNSETGEPGACRAKLGNCPFGGGESHHATRELARKSFEEQQEMIIALEQATSRSSPAAEAAIASKLSYSGPKPEWFENLPTTLQKNFFHCKPELLDVIAGPNGKIAVVWERNSIDNQDIWGGVERGYTISSLTYRDFTSGEIIGYLKATHVDRESSERSFGKDEWRGFRFLTDHDSFWGMDKVRPKSKEYSPGDETYPATNINPPELITRESKEKFVREARMLLKPHEPRLKEGVTESELDGELAELKKLAIEAMESNAENYKLSFIDFSRINDKYRGQGLGAGLYIYAAKKLAESGRALRGSGVQSPEAEKVWLRMGGDKRLPISVRPVLWVGRDYRNISSHYVLDYTTEEKS